MPVERLGATPPDGGEVGGKARSLRELLTADLPVPPGFVVTGETYSRFLADSGIGDDLDALLADHESGADPDALARQVQARVRETPVPDAVRREILDAYDSLSDDAADDGPLVAVRSSASAEDLPDASFAGQQDTYLNVERDALVDRVRDCWASLFTVRAVSYREEQGFDHEDVVMAVVVQQMVDAEKSGVLFTHDPTTGAPTPVVEAAWGLGEGVVSGTVTPDTYRLDADGAVTDVTVATQERMVVRDEDIGETTEAPVPETRADRRVLDDGELDALMELADRVVDHYGSPQDVEWAIRDGEVYLLQSRPITTIDDAGDSAAAGDAADGADGRDAADADPGTVLVSGLGASPGRASGTVRVVEQLDELDRVERGDVMVTPMTSPDMVPALQRVDGIVTDDGGLTSHAAIVARELGVPAVTGTGDATDLLPEGTVVAVDGERGTVSEPTPDQAGTDAAAADADETSGPTDADAPSPSRARDAPTADKPMTATDVTVNVSLPAAADRAAATGADGVGLLRLEHMVLETGTTPARFIADHGAAAYVDELVDGIQTVADAFYPRPVRVRTLDAPTDEFRELEGGEGEPREANPMLGYRGIRRSLEEPDVFVRELEAFAKLYEVGYDNVELMFPLVADADDLEAVKPLMREAGLDPTETEWGVMVETPASALVVEDLVAAGASFVSFGTNDLTQYTLAVDRNNRRLADRYDPTHPAVKSLLERVIDVCREHDVKTSICGEAGSDPEMVEFLVERGIDAVSVNIDAVADVQRAVKRTEQRLILDSVR